jgi:GDP-L-fucose synthase
MKLQADPTGIYANDTYPAEFIYQNLMIEANVIHHAFLAGVKKLLFLGSSCIYPRLAEQPIKESALLTGKLEPTNEPYAIAKIAGIKLCESYNRQYGDSHGVDYRSVMPTNLYGPGDTYHPENSHVIPALIRKFHDAKLEQKKRNSIVGSRKSKG